MDWNILNTVSALDVIIEESKKQPIVIFKHSTRCPVSAMALNRFESDWDADTEIKPYFLDLIAFRAVSNEIAERFGVVHQSPQIIMIENGQVLHHASHNSIDFQDLQKFSN
jgi:bacillithiol system protein YtxJ